MNIGTHVVEDQVPAKKYIAKPLKCHQPGKIAFEVAK